MLVWLVVFFDLPLWKMMEWVSWDYQIPNIWKKHVPKHQPAVGKANQFKPSHYQSTGGHDGYHPMSKMAAWQGDCYRLLPPLGLRETKEWTQWNLEDIYIYPHIYIYIDRQYIKNYKDTTYIESVYVYNRLCISKHTISWHKRWG